MKEYILVFAAVLLVPASSPGVEKIRFTRVLDLYKNAAYSSRMRAIPVHIAYQSWSATSISLDAADFEPLSEKKITTRFGYRQSADSGSQKQNTTKAFGGFLAGKRDVFGYYYPAFHTIGNQTKNNQLKIEGDLEEDLDTVKMSAMLCGYGAYTIAAYPDSPFPALGPHWEAVIELDGFSRYLDQQNYEPYIPDSLLFFWEKSIKQEFSSAARLTLGPAAGLGRMQNISAVYYAFELEKQLLENGVIDFPLSDRTMAELAEYLSKGPTWRLREHEYMRRYKAGIDSIISKDAAARADNLRLLSSFMIKRTLLKNEKPLLKGLRTVVGIDQRITGLYRGGSTRYPYIDRPDDNEKTFDINSNTQLNLRAEWGLPINRQLHLLLRGEKRLLSSRRGIEFWNEGRLDAHSLLHVNFDARLSIWPTTWTRMHLGFEDLLCYIIAPFQAPYRLFGDFSVYLEDHLAISFNCSGFFGDYSNRSYSRPDLQETYLNRGLRMTLALQYGL